MSFSEFIPTFITDFEKFDKSTQESLNSKIRFLIHIELYGWTLSIIDTFYFHVTLLHNKDIRWIRTHRHDQWIYLGMEGDFIVFLLFFSSSSHPIIRCNLSLVSLFFSRNIILLDLIDPLQFLSSYLLFVCFSTGINCIYMYDWNEMIVIVKLQTRDYFIFIASFYLQIM